MSHFGVDPSIESEEKEEIVILEKLENNVSSVGKVVKSVSTCPPARLPEKPRKMIRKPKKILTKKSALNKPSKMFILFFKNTINSQLVFLLRIWICGGKLCMIVNSFRKS